MASAASERAGKQCNPPILPLGDHLLQRSCERSERTERTEVAASKQPWMHKCPLSPEFDSGAARAA
eukprot:6214824-Pleurochrysis_carterae.AAC.6